uniref:Uncharacterized protein n=1 Tax=Siphoviridae sp. ctYaH2 TaxID=2825549 RepID=A0A8S5V5B2_9CAUD|nr:MAG TPA: hypothetical protein [Siphoviridae sp. ctYaH2]
MWLAPPHFLISKFANSLIIPSPFRPYIPPLKGGRGDVIP